MAMLAAPRRKQKVINLRAKNNDWSNDANKFGQRMLEKMGWSSGKGLGAKEDGIVEHVVARYKNDEKGLGFEDRNDQWTQHEDDFNALLANLSNDNSNEDKLHSGVSLEVKSKKSKARIHYHKFTRGKDIARYSEKDLANIFGKKSLRNKETPTAVFKDDIKPTEQVFTDKGSMEDYFKTKLSAFKSKNTNETLSECENVADFQGFSQNDKDNTLGLGFKPFSFYPPDDNILDSQTECIDSSPSKKSKKKKKSKKDKEHTNSLENEEQNNDVQNFNQEICTDESQVKPKKSKKRQHNVEIVEKIVSKKKSKPTQIIATMSSDSVQDNNDAPIKKKKKKYKDLD